MPIANRTTHMIFDASVLPDDTRNGTVTRPRAITMSMRNGTGFIFHTAIFDGNSSAISAMSVAATMSTAVRAEGRRGEQGDGRGDSACDIRVR